MGFVKAYIFWKLFNTTDLHVDVLRERSLFRGGGDPGYFQKFWYVFTGSFYTGLGNTVLVLLTVPYIQTL